MGLQQEELSKHMKVPRATYASYETGKRTPNIYLVARIALALEVEVSDLFPRKLTSLTSYDPSR